MKTFLTRLILLLSLSAATAYSQKFENAYILPGTDAGKDIAELSDGSIITVGTSNSYGAGGNDLFVMKTNVSGSILWIRYFGGTGDDGGLSVSVSPQDEIYAAGYKTTGTDKDGFVVKLNAAGTTIWSRHLVQEQRMRSGIVAIEVHVCILWVQPMVPAQEEVMHGS